MFSYVFTSPYHIIKSFYLPQLFGKSIDKTQLLRYTYIKIKVRQSPHKFHYISQTCTVRTLTILEFPQTVK